MQFTTRDVWRIAILSLVTVVVLSLMFLSSTGAQTSSDPEQIVPPEVQVAQLEYQAKEIVIYVQAEEKRHVAEYVSAVQEAERVVAAQQAQAAQEAQAARTVQPRPAAPAPFSSNVTGACGGATNGADQFIARESGGNANVYNSGGSGAWGCYQIMPGTWAGAGCNEFGAYGSASASAQAACASRLPMSAWGG